MYQQHRVWYVPLLLRSYCSTSWIFLEEKVAPWSVIFFEHFTYSVRSFEAPDNATSMPVCLVFLATLLILYVPVPHEAWRTGAVYRHEHVKRISRVDAFTRLCSHLARSSHLAPCCHLGVQKYTSPPAGPTMHPDAVRLYPQKSGFPPRKAKAKTGPTLEPVY